MTAGDREAVAVLARALDVDADGLDAATDAWESVTRDALGRGDTDEVRRLLDAADRAGAEARPAAALLAARTASVLDGPTVRGAIDAVRAAGRPIADLVVLLTRLGEPAVDAVLDALAAEEDRLERAALLGIASDLAPGHVGVVVARLDDDRWFVVRNALTILGRTGRAPLAPVTAAADHAHPAVRREACRVLIAGGSPAVPVLRRLAGDPDPLVRVTAIVGLRGIGGPNALDALVEVATSDGPTDVRRHALEGIAQVPGEDATATLARLASRDAEPGLPWRLRRHARKLRRSRSRSQAHDGEVPAPPGPQDR